MKKVESEKETWRMIAECKAGLWQDEIPCGEEFEIGEIEEDSLQGLKTVGDCVRYLVANLG